MHGGCHRGMEDASPHHMGLLFDAAVQAFKQGMLDWRTHDFWMGLVDECVTIQPAWSKHLRDIPPEYLLSVKPIKGRRVSNGLAYCDPVVFDREALKDKYVGSVVIFHPKDCYARMDGVNLALFDEKPGFPFACAGGPVTVRFDCPLFSVKP